MNHRRKAFKILLFCVKQKKIKVPKYILFKIVELAGLKYSFGFELCKNEDPYVIFKRACKVLNFPIMSKIFDLNVDLNKLLFIVGYIGNNTVFTYFAPKFQKNKQIISSIDLGSYLTLFFAFAKKRKSLRYGQDLTKNGNYTLKINNEMSIIIDVFKITTSITKRYFLEIRAICSRNRLDDVKKYLRENNNDGDFIEQGFYGACEGGNIPVAAFMLTQGAKRINRGLYIAKKNEHAKSVDFLISKGAKDVVYYISDIYDEYYALTKI